MKRTAIRSLLPSSLFVLVMLAGACTAQALDAKRERELTHLVRQDCGSCHGMTLKGGLGGALLPGALHHLESESVASIILEGVSGKPMPPWRGLLSEEEALWIAEQLKTGFPR
jgi:cytochrome c55X